MAAIRAHRVGREGEVKWFLRHSVPKASLVLEVNFIALQGSTGFIFTGQGDVYVTSIW